MYALSVTSKYVAALWLLSASPSAAFTMLPSKSVVLRSSKLAMSSKDSLASGVTFTYSPMAIKHLQNIELPADYSRPWTMEKTKALAAALALGGALGFGGEIFLHTLFDVDKTFPVFGAIGAAVGWNVMGGKEISDKEQPRNGGYDAKLVADRPARIRTTLEYLQERTPVEEIAVMERSEEEILKAVQQVHDPAYVKELEAKSKATDRPIRLNPRFARTLICENSYDAALAAVDSWMTAVDNAITEKPQFCLTRPPSHHACKGKGMGGCLLNSIAIAAHYALTKDGINSVAILDIDAHHGNGIAHCVQDNPSIKLVSMHEDAAANKYFARPPVLTEDDPRSAKSDDSGPNGNILNINLPPNANGEQFREELRSQALPFLGEADILLLAAGMDTMKEDWSSSLELNPTDFESIGQIVKEKYGNRVAFGLEGGYAYRDQELAKGLFALCQAWN